MYCPPEDEIWPFSVDQVHPNGKFTLIQMSRQGSLDKLLISCDLDQLRQLYEEIGSCLQAVEQAEFVKAIGTDPDGLA